MPGLTGRIVLQFEAMAEMGKVIVWELAQLCKVLQALSGAAFRVRVLQGAIRSQPETPLGEICAECQGEEGKPWIHPD